MDWRDNSIFRNRARRAHGGRRPNADSRTEIVPDSIATRTHGSARGRGRESAAPGEDLEKRRAGSRENPTTKAAESAGAAADGGGRGRDEASRVKAHRRRNFNDESAPEVFAETEGFVPPRRIRTRRRAGLSLANAMTASRAARTASASAAGAAGAAGGVIAASASVSNLTGGGRGRGPTR